FKLDQPKTKDFISALDKLGLEGKTLIVDSLDNANLILSARNVQGTKIVSSGGLNIYDLMYHDKLVLARAAVDELTALLDPKREAHGKAESANEEASAQTEATEEAA
ncbi:MAG TPA: 50S ribosomal protein L4, partial [Pyrinomonadaceae bacterium]|nr:50S ribosomal protein L4 [Pyrinomonadaceae bacterium]